MTINFTKIRSVFFSIFLGLLVVGCEKSDLPKDPTTPSTENEELMPTLMISKNKIFIDGKGGQASIVIASSDTWLATCPDPNITFKPSMGDSTNNDLTITVAESTIEKSVEFIVTITASNSAGKVEKQISITQSAGIAPPSYGIYTVNDLVEFAEAVNTGASIEDWQDEDGVVRQKADIDMSNYYGWEPIGFYTIHEDLSFTGTFDGNGYKFTNLDLTQSASYEGIAFGLFGSSVGTISNVVIESGSIIGRASSNYVASICGRNKGLIENCENSADVSLATESKGTYVGGIVAASFGELSNLTNRGDISDGGYSSGICALHKTGNLVNGVNYGTISSMKNAAGVVGYNNAVVKDCENHGDVFCTEDEYAAGIVTYNSFDSFIINCVNNGRVYGVGYGNSGITGTNWGTLENCVNNGEIEGDMTYAAGLVAANNGYIMGDGNINNGKVSGEAIFMGGVAGYNFAGSIITDAVNNGEIYAEYTGTSGMYTAGIVPYASPSSDSIIENCVNNGNVTCKSNSTHLVAGIIALTDLKISNCTNTGDINGGYYAGGIVARSETSNLVFEGCTNSGNVTTDATNGHAGGIMGCGHYYTTIKECDNSGNIKSEKGPCAGGITTKSLYLTVTDCDNSGDITCEFGSVGGIVASLLTNSTLSVCVNKGAITGGTGLGEAGGIAGFKDYTSTATDYLNEGSVNGVTPGADFGRTN